MVEVHPPHSEPELAQLEAHLGTGPADHSLAVRPRDIDHGDCADRRIEGGTKAAAPSGSSLSDTGRSRSRPSSIGAVNFEVLDR